LDSQDIYNQWLTEEFLLNEICRNPDQEQKLLNLYDYLRSQEEIDEGELSE